VALSKAPEPRERTQAGSVGTPVVQGGPVRDRRTPPAPVHPTRSLRLAPALIIFGVWICVLIGLALLSANPTVLNRAQILAAPLVVEATVAADDREQWQVSRSWPQAEVPRRILIKGLEPLRVDARQAFLIPVERTDPGEYRLVLSPKPFAAPLIYPANPQTVSELEAILGER